MIASVRGEGCEGAQTKQILKEKESLQVAAASASGSANRV